MVVCYTPQIHTSISYPWLHYCFQIQSTAPAIAHRHRHRPQVLASSIYSSAIPQRATLSKRPAALPVTTITSYICPSQYSDKYIRAKIDRKGLPRRAYSGLTTPSPTTSCRNHIRSWHGCTLDNRQLDINHQRHPPPVPPANPHGIAARTRSFLLGIPSAHLDPLPIPTTIQEGRSRPGKLAKSRYSQLSRTLHSQHSGPDRLPPANSSLS